MTMVNARAVTMVVFQRTILRTHLFVRRGALGFASLVVDAERGRVALAGL